MSFSSRQTSTEKIEAYVSRLSREDALLRRVRRQSDKHRSQHGCDVHPSGPIIGRLLSILVRATGARRVLELGCGLGYSAICIARALPPDGRVDTVERDPAPHENGQGELQNVKIGE